MPCTLQNGLYFVNIYRNITDINFPPVTYVYTVQMQQKNKNHYPILRSETSLTENKAPVSDKLQQCRKEFTQEGLLSGSLGQWKRPQSKMEVVSWNLIYKNTLTHLFYTHN